MNQDMSNGRNGSGHARCGAHCRGSGQPCQLPAGWGTGHVGAGRCRKHFGSTPNHQEHARRVLIERAEASALAELHRLDVEPMINPLQALAELAAEARAWQAILRAQVAELAALTERAPDGVERVRALVLLFERAMDRAATFAATMCKLNIDDRIVKLNDRIAEVQGERLAHAVTAIVVRLGHPSPLVDRAVGAICAEELGKLVDGDA
jgi:hypothetical protein